MPAVTPARFERLLGTLDEATLAAFVADLWAARGWETAVDGPTVVARDEARGRRLVLRCLAARPDRPWARQPDELEADVVVTARGPAAVRGLDLPDEVAVHGPDQLRAMLLYAVDRDRADRLFDEHFDRPLDGDRLDAGRRDRLAGPTARRLAGGAIVVVLAVALAVAALGGPVGTVGDPGTGPAATATSVSLETAPGTDGFEPPPAGGSLFRYPPGLEPAGVADPDALAAAHRDAAADRRWDLLLIHRGSKDLLNTDRRWVGSRQTVDRRTGSRYWYRVTGLERTGGDAFQSTIYDDYADGEANFRRVAGTPEPSYRRTRLPLGGGGVFAAASAAYVRRFLDTSASRVETVEFGSTNRYRVVATGTPRQFFSPIEDYRAVAIVDRRGLVHRLTVEFTRLDRKHAPAPTATPPAIPASNPPGTVRFEMVFRDVGTAAVDVPAWYGEARNATAGTEPGPWPNDPAV